MFDQVYRYDKPSDELFLDIINYTNNSAFQAGQLVFGTPEVIDGSLTAVRVKPTDNVGWTGAALVRYRRLDLGRALNFTPMIDTSDTTPEGILAALNAQYSLFLEIDKVTVTEVPRQLNVQVSTTGLTGFDTADAPDVPPAVPFDEGVKDFVITVASDHLIWFGSARVYVRPVLELMGRTIKQRLAMMDYFNQTDAAKVAIELAVNRAIDATPVAASIKKLKKGDVLTELTPFVEIARRLTGDAWVSNASVRPFNVYQSKVLYNGFNQGEYFSGFASYSHVLAVELSEYCGNLAGTWLIHYHDPEAFTLSNLRIDNGPLLDL